MAFTSPRLGTEPRAFSNGPKKFEFQVYSCVNGDTSGIIFSNTMTQLYAVIVDGLQCTSQVFNRNGVTITFTTPAVSATGLVMLLGV